LLQSPLAQSYRVLLTRNAFRVPCNDSERALNPDESGQTGLIDSPEGRLIPRPLRAMERLDMAQPSPQIVLRSPGPVVWLGRCLCVREQTHRERPSDRCPNGDRTACRGDRSWRRVQRAAGAQGPDTAWGRKVRACCANAAKFASLHRALKKPVHTGNVVSGLMSCVCMVIGAFSPFDPFATSRPSQPLCMYLRTD
jgi:hypothetical protein